MILYLGFSLVEYKFPTSCLGLFPYATIKTMRELGANLILKVLSKGLKIIGSRNLDIRMRRCKDLQGRGYT